MATVPATMKALVAVGSAANASAPSTVKGRGANVQDVPVPTITDDEILVKVTAVSLNPTDYKHIDQLSPDGAVVGCDYAGVVAQVGAGSTATSRWKIGDRVAGWVHGGLYPDRGSFAQYLKIDADLAWRVPDGVSDLAASTYGVSATTAMLGLNKHFNVPWPTATPAPATGEPILIYAASTGAGLYAARLAKLAGRTVVATASPHNFDLVKSYGADAVFDYKSPTAAADIRAAYPNLTQAFDGISENGTTEFCASVLQPGGTVVVLLPPKATEIGGVTILPILVYTLFGREFHLLPPNGPKYPASAEDRAAFATFYGLLPEVVGALKPIPVKELAGGLENLGEGLSLLREGKVSGTKLGYQL